MGITAMTNKERLEAAQHAAANLLGEFAQCSDLRRAMRRCGLEDLEAEMDEVMSEWRAAGDIFLAHPMD